MTVDRITEIRIEGLRVFEKIALGVRGLSVLIGENGAGKSTLCEAFELLRLAGEQREFAATVLSGSHGPFRALLRDGAEQLTVGVVVEGGGPKLDYSFTATLAGAGCWISHEHLFVHAQTGQAAPLTALVRTPKSAKWFDQSAGKLVDANVAPMILAAPSAAAGLIRQEAFERLALALRAIEVHPPFDVRPLWQQQELLMRDGPRWPSVPQLVTSVRRYGQALPAAILAVRNQSADRWQRFIERARVTVGVDLIDMALEPAGAGQLEVTLRFKDPARAMSVASLSEGQLSYLLALATIELGAGRSVLVLDEPDIHYHPALAVNLIWLLEELAETCPVIVATHSDRLLDALSDPARSAVLCELGPGRRSTLRRPNPEALDAWLEKYRGLGSIRAAGYEAHVFDGGKDVTAESKP